ncbi:DUF2218 domain-containing protein [Sulfitobacter sp. BDSS02]|nr:DUF2218 domain-containing protein [Sulfitobacter sp. BDSS02]MBR9850552.1 DUF2218 domain-containing protein [Paracoccaceae bacterium]
MLSASARFETPNASKYLKQLCKHFAHKVSVDYDDTNGKAALPPGPAMMQADDAALLVTVTAQDEEGLERAKFIIDDHLSRFAFRETPDLNWEEPATV